MSETRSFFFPLSRHRDPALEPDLDLLGLVRRQARDGRQREDVLRRLDPRVLEDAALDADAPEVLVEAVGLLLRDRHRDAVQRGVLDLLVAARELPLAHRRDDLQVRRQRHHRDVEAHLVVALAGGAVGHGLGAFLLGDLDEVLGDQRPPEGGRHQVLALVDGAGLERRHDVLLGELAAQVAHDGLHGAGLEGLGPDRLEVLLLAEVGDEGDDVVAVLLAEPLDDDRGVEAPGVRQNDLLRILLRHRPLPSSPRSGRFTVFSDSAVASAAPSAHAACFPPDRRRGTAARR